VLIGVLGVSERTYGYLFASTALGLVAGAFASARLSGRGVRAARLITAGLAVAAAVAVTLTGLATAGRLTVPLLVALIIVGNVAQGMMRPNAVQAALEPVADIAGAASALLSGLQMLTGALASATAAALFDGRSAVAMTGTMAVCATGALLVYLGVVRPAERRRRAARATSGSAAAGAGTPRAAA
jgi:DHA1 family bicyclomycin/chloramphenicol resistance-like MFS transporter